MKSQEIVEMRGEVSIRGYNELGECVLSLDKKNLVVNGGKGVMATLLRLGTSSLIINGIAFGTSSVAPALGDTAITGAFTKATASSSNPTTNSVQWDWTLETSENNGMNIREIGLISDRTGTPTLFSRIVTESIVKTSSLRLEGTWKLTF